MSQIQLVTIYRSASVPAPVRPYWTRLFYFCHQEP